MSTVQDPSPEAAPEKKRGFDKYVAKFKKALERSNSGFQKRLSTSGPSGLKPSVVEEKAEPQAETTKAEPAADSTGIQLSAADRVERTPRRRVHRDCHVCRTPFGRQKVCDNCHHQRCKECPRTPAKKNKAVELLGADDDDAAAAVLLEQEMTKATYKITRPSKVPGAPDLVLKKPTQRVRRTCHQCQTLFAPHTKTCANCSHVRCTDCPRDPEKSKKYPYGYPGDEPGNKNVHYSCHVCRKIIAPSESKCPKCTHEKCDQCCRVFPGKVEPQPDPEVLRSVEEKLASLNIARGAGTA